MSAPGRLHRRGHGGLVRRCGVAGHYQMSISTTRNQEIIAAAANWYHIAPCCPPGPLSFLGSQILVKALRCCCSAPGSSERDGSGGSICGQTAVGIATYLSAQKRTYLPLNRRTYLIGMNSLGSRVGLSPATARPPQPLARPCEQLGSRHNSSAASAISIKSSARSVSPRPNAAAAANVSVPDKRQAVPRKHSRRDL